MWRKASTFINLWACLPSTPCNSMMKKKWIGGNHREHCPVSSSSIWSLSSEVLCNSPISQGYYQFSLSIWYHIWYYVYCLYEMFYPNRFLFWGMRYEEYFRNCTSSKSISLLNHKKLPCLHFKLIILKIPRYYWAQKKR